MGAWSEDIFGNDMACDVRDAYRERIQAGNDATTAFKLVKKEFAEEMREADDKRTIFIAFAAAQLEAGSVTDIVRETALKAIAWCEHPDRDAEQFPFGLAALAKLREKLGGKPPPPPKPAKPPKPKVAPGEAGDVLALTLPGGYSCLRPNCPAEVVIFVAGPMGNGHPSHCGLVVMLNDLAVEEVTPELVVRTLSAWGFYRNQRRDGSLGGGVFCYNVSGKLPPRKMRLLRRGIEMPEGFVKRMKRYGKANSSFQPHEAKMFPHDVNFDVGHWHSWKWALDPAVEKAD